jgi:hypothetical protein
MEESQFDAITSELSQIQTDTSWIWYNNNELEKLNKTMSNVEKLIDENNDLLQELIDLMRKRA